MHLNHFLTISLAFAVCVNITYGDDESDGYIVNGDPGAVRFDGKIQPDPTSEHRTQLYHERWRPQIHFSPPENWLSDPSGM